MVIKAIYPPFLYDYDRLYNYFEPRLVQTNSILEILIPVKNPIFELGTELPYHESYTFWTHPESTVTKEDILRLRQSLYGEEFEYPIASEAVEELWHTGHKPEESQETGFTIPSAWGGDRR